MCALPLEVSRQDSRESSGSGFWKRLEALEAKYRDLWLAVPDSRPIIGPRTTWWRRATNYRHCRRLLDWLIEEVQGLPEDGHQSQEWRDSVKQRVQQLGEERLDWPESYRELVVSDQFYESTIRFIRRARAFEAQCQELVDYRK